MSKIRKAAVAGRFYPGASGQLRQVILSYLAQAGQPSELLPKALIGPHAGYLYSGPVAASAYACLTGPERRTQINRVVLAGPAHFVPIDGIALSSAAAFATPLGQVPVDRAGLEQLTTLPQVQILDEAHDSEHSLEVHLPFLQVVLDNFSLIPLAVGEISLSEMTEVLEMVWGGPETLIVVSSDLSHFLDYETARQVDQVTSQAIEALNPAEIGPQQACGRHPIRGLLALARRHGLVVKTVDLRNSGDTAGPKERVVGYGAYIFTPAA